MVSVSVPKTYVNWGNLRQGITDNIRNITRERGQDVNNAGQVVSGKLPSSYNSNASNRAKAAPIKKDKKVTTPTITPEVKKLGIGKFMQDQQNKPTNSGTMANVNTTKTQSNAKKNNSLSSSMTNQNSMSKWVAPALLIGALYYLNKK